MPICLITPTWSKLEQDSPEPYRVVVSPIINHKGKQYQILLEGLPSYQTARKYNKTPEIVTAKSDAHRITEQLIGTNPEWLLSFLSPAYFDPISGMRIVF